MSDRNQLLYASMGGGADWGEEPPPPAFDYVDPEEDVGGSVPNEILYSKNGRLIFKDGFHIALMTWWDFDQASVGSPHAYINGVEVCPGHSTTHIIDYDVSNKDFNGRGSNVAMTVVMSMTVGEGGDGGAPCIHRIWGGAADFYDAEKKHRAEKSGTATGGATFTIRYDIDSGDYRIS